MHVFASGLHTPSFEHPTVQNETTKINFLQSILFLSSIHIPTSALALVVHRSAIVPSGQMHAKFESMTIQTPASLQYECSQRAIKRRARKSKDNFEKKFQHKLTNHEH